MLHMDDDGYVYRNGVSVARIEKHEETAILITLTSQIFSTAEVFILHKFMEKKHGG